MERVIRGALPHWVEAFSGYGSGYGDGDGSGYGSGDGDGYGDGSGYGSGSGSGSGYGYGDGDGDGDGSYWRMAALALVGKVKRLTELWDSDASFLAFWKSNKNGLPANGGAMSEAAYPGMKQTINGPLELCGPRALHATLNPEKWKGDRLWIVALHGDVAMGEDKVGALEREIICEVK